MTFDLFIGIDYSGAGDSLVNQFPFTPVQQRTRRGLHLVYRHPGGHVPNMQKLNGQAVDVRGDGGYVPDYPDSQQWTFEMLSEMPVFQGFDGPRGPAPGHERPSRLSHSYNDDLREMPMVSLRIDEDTGVFFYQT